MAKPSRFFASILLVTFSSTALATASINPAAAQQASDNSSGCTPTVGPPIKAVYKLDELMNGITVSNDGRVFGPIQQISQHPTLRVGEVKSDGSIAPYPDAAWNNFRQGDDASDKFVTAVSVRVGPEGDLWVVDKGSIGMPGTVLPGGPKLVRIDLATDAVKRIYSLDDVAKAKSFFDDVRFGGSTAFLTDAGEPGLVVLDLETGTGRRVMDGAPSVTGTIPLKAEGHELKTPDGDPITFGADQLELSPDNLLLYYQPTSGPISAVATELLTDPKGLPATSEKGAMLFAPTPTVGGTTMAANGDIYFSDTDVCAIRKITPAGKIVDVLRDPRLVWVDAMWIDDTGHLFMPASQFSRTPPLNGGKNSAAPPYVIYSADLHLKPLRR